MTDNDYILTANYIEAMVRKELEMPRGHFMTYYWTAMQNLAMAYYHADSSNQRIMRKTFAPVWEEFNNARLQG